MSEPGWLAPETFSLACAALPLVSIDLFLVRSGESVPELLLGRRNNRPARGWWFTPGGRIRKSEPIDEAMARVAAEEVGLAPDLLRGARLLGAWDHFYPDSAFDASVSTHYVNLAYLVQVPSDVVMSLAPPAGPESQHSAWRWMALAEVGDEPGVHENVRIVVPSILSPQES